MCVLCFAMMDLKHAALRTRQGRVRLGEAVNGGAAMAGTA